MFVFLVGVELTGNISLAIVAPAHASNYIGICSSCGVKDIFAGDGGEGPELPTRTGSIARNCVENAVLTETASMLENWRSLYTSSLAGHILLVAGVFGLSFKSDSKNSGRDTCTLMPIALALALNMLLEICTYALATNTDIASVWACIAIGPTPQLQ